MVGMEIPTLLLLILLALCLFVGFVLGYGLLNVLPIRIIHGFQPLLAHE